MAKDLEFTAKVASGLSNSARKDEALKKLIDAWNSKNAQAGKRVGTFGFMASALAACGGGSGNNTDALPGGGVVEPIFRLITNAGVFDAANPVEQDGLLSVTQVDQIVPNPVVDGALIIAAGETYVGDISLFDDGIIVTGDGNLWLVAPDAAVDSRYNGQKVQTVVLDVTLQNATLTFDMPSDAYTIIVDDASKINLNGGTLQISDGKVLVSAAEYATWNVGNLIVNSTLEIDFRGVGLTEAQIVSLVSALDAATSTGNTASAVRFLVADDAQAAAVFQGLQSNSAISQGIAPKIEVETPDGTSVQVNLESIIDSKIDFLAQILEKQLESLETKLAGPLVEGDIATLKALSDAVKALQTLTGSNGAIDLRLDALELAVGAPAAGESTASGLYLIVQNSIAAAVSTLQSQINAINSNTDSVALNSIAELKAAVEALQSLAGQTSVSSQISSAIGLPAAQNNGTATGLWAGIESAIAAAVASLGQQITTLRSDITGGTITATQYDTLKEISDALATLNGAAAGSVSK
ncbi:MAG: hypothetical protein IKE14_07660, partial [Loktanella sp.]|nr:hypothetical protein [Loktanella sp.]